MRSYPKLGEPLPQRILILRALQLGDLLCAVPAFRALKRALPDAIITLIGLPWSREFVNRFDYYLDDFIEFPGFPGFPERTPQIRQLPKFLTEIQWLNFDLALQMQGSGGISNSIVELLGATHSAGFYLSGQYCPDPARYLPYPVLESEVWRHLRLMEFLGFPLQGDELEFPLYPADWEAYRDLERSYALKAGQFICIHPGSRAEERRWAPACFAAVADGITALGYQVVLTGTADEAYLTAAVAGQMESSVIDLAGRTHLGALGALLSSARLLITNDTGVSHIAAALRTPSVVLFSASDPNRWAPGDRALHRVVAWATAASPQTVLAEAESLLGQERVYVD